MNILIVHDIYVYDEVYAKTFSLLCRFMPFQKGKEHVCSPRLYYRKRVIFCSHILWRSHSNKFNSISFMGKSRTKKPMPVFRFTWHTIHVWWALYLWQQSLPFEAFNSRNLDQFRRKNDWHRNKGVSHFANRILELIKSSILMDSWLSKWVSFNL